MLVRKIKSGDLEEIAAIHTNSFPNFFLTKLGKKFLVNYYSLFESDGSVSVVVEDEGEIVGFSVGYNDGDAFFKMLKSNFLKFLPAILCALRRVDVVAELLKKIAKSLFKSRINEIPDKPENYNELASIAVSLKYKGKGVGAKLLQAYIEKVQSQEKCGGVIITTDKYGNDQVVDFYKRNGFRLVAEFQQSQQREMLCFAYDFE